MILLLRLRLFIYVDQRVLSSPASYTVTPFAVKYEKIRIRLRKLTTNSGKMHS